MSTVDLGIRVLMTDLSAAGFIGLAGTLGKFGGLIENLSGKWAALPGYMQVAGGVALGSGILFLGFADALKHVVDAAADLQDTMAKMQVAVRGTTENYQAMQDTLIQIANQSVFTTKEVGDGFIAMGQHGQDATDIISGTGQAMVYFAEATNSETVPAATLLATAMQTYSASASQAAQFSDILTFAFENGIPSVTGLQSALTQVGGIAAELGIPFGDLMATLDELAKKIPNASTAGADLRYMLATLTDPIPKAQKELSDLGIITLDSTVPAFKQFVSQLDAAADAANKTPVAFDGTLTSLQAMFTQAQKLGTVHTDETMYQWAIKIGLLNDKLFDATGKFGGVNNMILQLGQALDKIKDPKQKIAALEQLFNVKSGQGGTALLNDWKQVLDQIKKLEDGANKSGTAQDNAAKKTDTFNSSIKKLKTSFTDLEAVIGTPLLDPLTKFTNKLNDLTGNLTLQHPALTKSVGMFLLLGTAFLGVLAIGALLVVGLGALAAAIGWIPIVIGLLIAAVIALYPLLLRLSNMMWDALGKVGAAIQNTNFGLVFHVYVEEPIRVFFVKLGNSIADWGKNCVQMLIDSIKNAFGGFVSGALTPLGALFKKYLGFHSPPEAGPLAESDQWMPNMMRMFVSGILGGLGWIGNAINSVGSTIWGGIQNAFGRAVGAVQGGMGNVVNTVSGLPGQLMGALSGLGSMLYTSGANMMTMLGNGIKSGIGWVTTQAQNAAQAIANFLEHKSPAKEGPLSRSDTFMPNMMKMYAKGILDHSNLIHGAIGTVTTGMAHSFGSVYTGSRPSQSGYGSSSTQLNVYVGSQKVADCVIDHISGQLKMNNMTTAWR